MLAKLWDRENKLRATRESTDYFFDIYLGLGLRKVKKWKILYIFYSLLMNLSVFVGLPVCIALSYLLEHSKMTTVQMLTSMQAALNIWGFPIKALIIFFSLKRIYDSMDLMDILDALCQRADEHKKIRHCAMMGNRMTLFFNGLYVLYSIVIMITSLSKGQPTYSIYIPFLNWRTSKVHFAIQAIIEFVVTNIACLHEGENDVYAIIFVYVIRTHMQILVERVRRLGTDVKTSNDEHYNELLICIKYHQHLIRLVEIISPLISLTMFIQFTITAVILGTTLINILIFADTAAQIASVVYFLAVMVQTSPMCYQSTCLLYDSEQLSLAIFQCEWFNKDKRFRKMLIFFMMRSQTPITLTALKLFPINLNTSLAIAKFSFSLYTLMKEMDIGKKFKPH